MEQRISELVKDRQAEFVLELILDNTKCTRIAGDVLNRFQNLEVLSLNGCGLVTLEGFPSLPRLSRLELADNRLKDGLSELVNASLGNLRHLNLAGNTKFDDLEQLKPTAKLGIRSLDLYQCGVTKIENYRAESFKIIPSLKYLDGTDIHGNEEEEDDDDPEDEEATEQDDDLEDDLTHDEFDHDEFDEAEDDEDKVVNLDDLDQTGDDEEEDEEEDEGVEMQGEGDMDQLDYLIKDKDNLTEDEEEEEEIAADEVDELDTGLLGSMDEFPPNEDVTDVTESPSKRAKVEDCDTD